jgi:hypothetical protein
MDKNKNLPVIAENKTLLETSVGEYQIQLGDFLDYLGLPKDNILVDVNQRKKVIENLPAIVETISAKDRSSSYYISKFVAACSSGLFDAALNYIWDETINNLRKKIDLFDLEYFKSTLDDDDVKKKIKTLEDLKKIDDWSIVRGCNVTGIISEIGFKHLDYIRNMRNWASAAHPNHVQLTGLQISSWLEVCINEVIGKEPSIPAIQAQQLLHNIRTNELTKNDIIPIEEALKTTPEEIIVSIFKTVFGMFVDPDTKVEIKNNIRLIAKTLWSVLPEEQKKEAGIKNANWAANADIARRDTSRDFLETVDALSYLPPETLNLEMYQSIILLKNAHFNFNNFYNEAPYAKLLRKYIPDNGNIPKEVRVEYVKTITLCFIGNGWGVAWTAYPIYSELFGKFTDKEFKIFVSLFKDADLSSRMQFEYCRKAYRHCLNVIDERTPNETIKRVINYILSQTDEQLPDLGKTTEYNKLLAKLR